MKPCLCAPREAASYEDLQAAAARQGAVIVLIPGQYSCNAIIARRQETQTPTMYPYRLLLPQI
jgi:hypothetical protein